jgi:uncharacterized membrane protein YozB (DUF420 family)
LEREAAMNWAIMPSINASLNATCALLLITGWILIRRGDQRRHRILMITAFATSCLFLLCYLTYHAQVGSVRYQGQGLIRTVYFTILLTHTVLAAVIVPLILRTLFLAVKGRNESHRRWARWTMPLWLYVSVTGVVIYEMLY